MRIACAALALMCVGVQVIAPAVAQAAPPPGGCLNKTTVTALRKDVPWEDKVLAPERVWPVTKGAGVRVGVVDSGVDSDNLQMRGRVFLGYDFVRDKPGARFDCAAHGTPVASIIAAAPMEGTGFHGVAPDARIVPARVTDTDEIKGGAAIVAAGIHYVVDNGIKVLNLSLTMADDPVLKSAVEYAQAHDVLVVAAAGNHSEEGNPTPYPAAYPGVLGVGSIDIAGARASDSQVGPYVKLVAPGVQVTGANPIKGLKLNGGTSFAAPFVSGVAALVRAHYPKLTADQVADRLIKTASVARGGKGSQEYGAGVVDPYRAVTDTTLAGDGSGGAKPTPIPAPQPDLVAQRKAAAVAAENGRARHTALLLIGGTAVALILAGLFVAGHRRRWQVARKTS
jgi:type VII secretion-associated serine protease mycosin